MSALHLRRYRPEDEAASIDLWHRTWQQAYPQIDFAARLEWWRERWLRDLVTKASIVVAEQDGALTGFVTIDDTGYLDQLVVGPVHWGSSVGKALVDIGRRQISGDDDAQKDRGTLGQIAQLHRSSPSACHRCSGIND